MILVAQVGASARDKLKTVCERFVYLGTWILNADMAPLCRRIGTVFRKGQCLQGDLKQQRQEELMV